MLGRGMDAARSAGSGSWLPSCQARVQLPRTLREQIRNSAPRLLRGHPRSAPMLLSLPVPRFSIAVCIGCPLALILSLFGAPVVALALQVVDAGSSVDPNLLVGCAREACGLGMVSGMRLSDSRRREGSEERKVSDTRHQSIVPGHKSHDTIIGAGRTGSHLTCPQKIVIGEAATVRPLNDSCLLIARPSWCSSAQSCRSNSMRSNSETVDNIARAAFAFGQSSHSWEELPESVRDWWRGAARQQIGVRDWPSKVAGTAAMRLSQQRATWTTWGRHILACAALAGGRLRRCSNTKRGSYQTAALAVVAPHVANHRHRGLCMFSVGFAGRVDATEHADLEGVMYFPSSVIHIGGHDACPQAISL